MRHHAKADRAVRLGTLAGGGAADRNIAVEATLSKRRGDS
jgi:hypothetical protein